MGCACQPFSAAPPLPYTELKSPPPPTTARYLFLSLRSKSYSTAAGRHEHRNPPASRFNFQLLHASTFGNPNSSGGFGNDNGNGGGGGGGENNWFNSDEDGNSSSRKFSLFLICSVVQLASAAAKATNVTEEEEIVLWEVKGGKKTKLIPDHFRDVFVVPSVESSLSVPFGNFWVQCRDLFMRLMLPEGFPHSVTSDYLEYSLWRGVQGVAAQISGVLATQVS